MIAWLQQYETVFWWMGVFSGVMFVLTLILVPVLVCRIPAHYFNHAGHSPPPGILARRRHPMLQLLLTGARGVVGVVLILMGILMLVLPGQGVITILIGITFLDFPGKYRLEKWIVSKPAVLNAINWFRRRRGTPELMVNKD